MSLNQEVQEELEAIAVRCGCELLQASYQGGSLRLVIDRDEGVTIDHCSNVSREASAYLDVVDFGSGRYTLEVSSPGLDRELYSDSDFKRFLGEQVRVSWIDRDRKRTDVARLKDYEQRPGSRPEIEIELDEGVRKVPLDQVVKARLEPNL